MSGRNPLIILFWSGAMDSLPLLWIPAILFVTHRMRKLLRFICMLVFWWAGSTAFQSGIRRRSRVRWKSSQKARYGVLSNHRGDLFRPYKRFGRLGRCEIYYAGLTCFFAVAAVSGLRELLSCGKKKKETPEKAPAVVCRPENKSGPPVKRVACTSPKRA